MPTKAARTAANQRQIDRLDRSLAAMNGVNNRYSWARAIVFLGGLVISATGFFVVGAGLFWLLLGVAVALFAGVIYFHRRLERSMRSFTLAREYHRIQAARVQVAWSELPPTREVAPRSGHPFEGDLDLVGERSLHRLMDTTVFDGGSLRLRDWLGSTAPNLDTIGNRQALVAELCPRSLFRLRLWINGSTASGDPEAADRETWQPDDLLDWLSHHQSTEQMRPRLWLLSGLALLNLVAVATSLFGLIEPWWYFTFLLYFGVYMLISKPARGVFHEATALQGALEQLASVIGQLERRSYVGTPYLRALCLPFLDQSSRPTHYLNRIKTVAAATGVQGNPVIWFLLNAVVPWDYFFAYQLNRTKAEVVDYVPQWLDVWAELEALCALANLGYVNPQYTQPEVVLPVEQERGEVAKIFSATRLGHPLLPDDEKVCNDFVMDHLGQVIILTGSNMAGKSTFLKTLGVNLALAFAGGPVDATCLQTDLFRLFTCIKVSDSVTDGISYFYAEVKRLKAMLEALDGGGLGDGRADREEAGDGPEDETMDDLVAQLPLFFLIDEIFRGTNNRERLEGSRSFIHALVGKHGSGLISTHDLDLVKLADEMASVRNYHFRDAIEDERMVFDYKLRSGPCPTTNALKIMALEGLPVGLPVGQK